MKTKANFLKGILDENPIFVFLLGMCPTLAVSAYVETALGMGILVILVLIGSNVVISLMKNIIPDEIRIPAFIVIIATFVTMIEMLTNAYAGSLADSLGVFIPLIVVNCVILGRAESFASKNNVFDSFIDAVGMGVGFTMAIVIIAFFRELLATGSITYGVYLPLGIEGSFNLFKDTYGLKFFGMPPGAFVTLGIILAFIASMGIKKALYIISIFVIIVFALIFALSSNLVMSVIFIVISVGLVASKIVLNKRSSLEVS